MPTLKAVKPIPFVTPDGVERQLRATSGARKLIVDQYQMDVSEVLNKYKDAALPDIIWALLHDEDGNPPAGLTAKRLAFTLPINDSPRQLACVAAALSQGDVDPNAVEAMLSQVMDSDWMSRVTPSGSDHGDSPSIASDSPTESTGGDTSNVKSEPLPEPAETLNTSEPN